MYIKRTRRPRRPASQPRPIGIVLDRAVHSAGVWRTYHGWRIVHRWPEIVGETVARHTEALRFDSGTLLVAVPEAAWRHSLSMDAESILEKIRSQPYGEVVKDLRLVRGEKGK